MSGSRLPKAQKMTTDSSPRSDSISLDAKTPRITYSCSPKPVDLLRCADSPIEYEWTADIAKFFTPGTKKLVKLLKDLDLYDGIVPHELLVSFLRNQTSTVESNYTNINISSRTVLPSSKNPSWNTGSITKISCPSAMTAFLLSIWIF